MNCLSTQFDERRQGLRLTVKDHPRLRLTLDGTTPDSDLIEGVTLCDISHQGLMASDAGMLVPGARVQVEIPLVGWRDAEVIWIVDDRAGCRFLAPLDLHELRLAAAGSQRLAELCPKLRERIIAFASPVHPANDAAPPHKTAASSQASRLGWGLVLLTFAALAAAAFSLTNRLLAG